eukprot:gb/GFBE01038570.1/.p1 GENE.gb/GFBE01038570.1/~~gb/GFBE01038570.1/.p1  ORF type:complete len:109 (+),score=26.75 gb/GFBE01038570.1/:1-327(+)
MQLRLLALWLGAALIGVTSAGGAEPEKSIRGKSDLSLVIAAQALPTAPGADTPSAASVAKSAASVLQDVMPGAEDLADVVNSATAEEVSGVQASVGPNADNDDLEKFD